MQWWARCWPPRPGKGELRAALHELAAKSWQHPISAEPVRFGTSTIERWYYRARRERQDPVAVLRRKLRSDVGRQTALNEPLAAVLLTQYREHPRWSGRSAPAWEDGKGRSAGLEETSNPG